MNKSTKKRNERLAQVEFWQKSTLSKKAYCKEIGISEDSFSYWNSQYLKEIRKQKERLSSQEEVRDTEGEFISLSAATPQLEAVSKEEPSFEVSLPNGIVVKIQSNLSLSLLKMLKDV